MKRILFFATLILALGVATDVEAKEKRYKNGDLYEGEMAKGLPSGTGVMVYANGDKYEGMWRYGSQSGDGVMSYANGERYEGTWSGSLRSGNGEMTNSNGDKYKGRWIEDKLASGVVMTCANGDQYIGSLRGGLRQGRGKMTYGNGDEYNGEWSEGLRSGNGLMKYADGTTYKCSWVNDKVDESIDVEIIYANTHKYKGRVKNGLRDGQGRYINSASTSSGYKDGVWQENEFISGNVLFVKNFDTNMPSSIKEVKGNYSNGVINGAIEYVDKSRYVGCIKDYKRNGEGLLSSGESKIEGEWLDDKIIDAKCSVRHLNRGYNVAILSNNDGSVQTRYTDEKSGDINLNLNLTELSQWGKYIIEAATLQSAQINARNNEIERKKAEEARQQRIKQARANAKYYVWRDRELASINKSNPAKLSAMIGGSRLIIQGTVRDIRKFTETKFDIIYDTYQHTYYIIQLDGIALRCDDGNAVAMLSTGGNIYADVYYTNDTFFTDKYPLFKGSAYTSVESAVDEILESRSNQLDYYIRCPHRQ